MSGRRKDQMTEKELKKLSRIDLLEMLLEQSKEVERLNAELKEAQKKLEDRSIQLDEAGSIAEAALRLNGIFDIAQIAADKYLDNLQTLSGRTDEICDRKREKCEQEIREKREATERECEELKQKAERFYQEKVKEAELKSDEMIKDAEMKVEARWNMLSEQLETFYKAHQGLREMLSFSVNGDETNEA